MGKTFPISLLALCLLPHFFLANCSSLLAPALYVFGDSLVDSGNNDFLNTSSKANYYPYGIDFPSGTTGRFTNGYTFADVLALFLGLPLAPPYMGLSEAQKNEIITGINYASGAAGILPETGKAVGKNLELQKQIEFFQETVNNYLPKNFETNNELLEHLSNALFLVDIGSNDYLNNYLQPTRYNSSQLYTPVQFAGILVEELQQHLEDLYNMGARRFLVFNIGPIGCAPFMVYGENLTSGCAEDVNQLISLYNEGLKDMLQELSSSLQGSAFIQAEFYASGYDLNQNPNEYGFTNRSSCCVIDNETSKCIQDVSPCMDRTTHIYWDGVHPSEQANFLFASGCFFGLTDYCTPLNILQLTQNQYGTTHMHM